MTGIDAARYSQIQGYEFEFWQNNVVDFQVLWGHYLPPFVPHLPKHCGTVVDVGSGPMPFFLSGLFDYDEAWAVDPLIYEYAMLRRYAPLYSEFSMRRTIGEIEDQFADTVFALNVLDHVRDPELLIAELGRICKPGGLLFFFVDIDKLPDHMHPHRLDGAWTREWIELFFEIVHAEVLPSWKFDNLCLWIVGRRFHEGSAYQFVQA